MRHIQEDRPSSSRRWTERAAALTPPPCSIDEIRRAAEARPGVASEHWAYLVHPGAIADVDLDDVLESVEAAAFLAYRRDLRRTDHGHLSRALLERLEALNDPALEPTEATQRRATALLQALTSYAALGQWSGAAILPSLARTTLARHGGPRAERVELDIHDRLAVSEGTEAPCLAAVARHMHPSNEAMSALVQHPKLDRAGARILVEILAERVRRYQETPGSATTMVRMLLHVPGLLDDAESMDRIGRINILDHTDGHHWMAREEPDVVGRVADVTMRHHPETVLRILEGNPGLLARLTTPANLPWLLTLPKGEMRMEVQQVMGRRAGRGR